MRILTVDTSTTALVTGLFDGVFRAAIVEGTRAHNELLMPTIEQLLASANTTYAALDAVVVGCGPGPFTGLRVGMATGSALASALSIPAYGVCSHDATAWDVWAGGVRGRVLVAEDARRKEIYWSVFDVTEAAVERVEGPDVVRPEALEVTGVEYAAISSTLYERLPEALQVERLDAQPTPAGLTHAAGIDVAAKTLPAEAHPLVPLYLRRPDATPPAAQPLSPAIPQRGE